MTMPTTKPTESLPTRVNPMFRTTLLGGLILIGLSAHATAATVDTCTLFVDPF